MLGYDTDTCSITRNLPFHTCFFIIQNLLILISHILTPVPYLNYQLSMYVKNSTLSLHSLNSCQYEWKYHITIDI